MRVRIGPQNVPWSGTVGTWYHDHEGEEFEVVAIHDGLNRLYEVDVRHLAARGLIGMSRAFVPAAFAEEVDEPVTAVVGRWDAAS
jgi:hypothetical protein